MNRLMGLRGELRQMHVDNVVPLPAETPFGNLFLKEMDVVNRLIHANRRLDETEALWRVARDMQSPTGDDPFAHHRFSADEVVVQLRRAMDELIGLLWVLAKHDALGDWPSRVGVDSIGTARTDAGEWKLPLLERHSWLAETLNELSNAHKHSFVNSDFQAFGRDEPVVFALGLKGNSRNNDAAPYSVSLNSLVAGFNSFFTDVVNELRKFDPQLHGRS